jgi:hypothetical protein
LKNLINTINNNTIGDNREIIDALLNMTSKEKRRFSLSEEDVERALCISGEFLVLKLSYEDFEDELKSEKIKYQISQSLSVIVSYEDDGKSFHNIEKFVNYIADHVDPKQNSIFGIKEVSKLSHYPVTILFSGILPINQLRIHLGQKLYDLMHSDKEYYAKRFIEFRETLSKEIGIPILPLFPSLDTTLKPTEVVLNDTYDNRLISRFITEEYPNKDTAESYLMKLFYIYKRLVIQKKCKALT